MSGNRGALLRPSPLKTVRDTFASHGLSKRRTTLSAVERSTAGDNRSERGSDFRHGDCRLRRAVGHDELPALRR